MSRTVSLVDRLDRDVRPGAGPGAGRIRALERLDREHDVVGGHGLAVMPDRVVANA